MVFARCDTFLSDWVDALFGVVQQVAEQLCAKRRAVRLEGLPMSRALTAGQHRLNNDVAAVEVGAQQVQADAGIALPAVQLRADRIGAAVPGPSVMPTPARRS